MNPGSFFVALHINNWSSGPILIMLSRPPVLFLRKWLEFFVWSCLVPAGYVILAFEEAAVTDADLLVSDFQVFIEANRVLDVPAVESALWYGVVVVVVVVDQFAMREVVWISHVRGAVVLFHGFPVYLFCEAPGAAEVVFGSSSAVGWVVFVAIHIEFYFAFSPPVAFQRGQCQIGSHIVSSSFYAVQNHIVFLQFGDFLPSPLRTEICGVLFDNTRGLLA